jgi:single-stranded DNA-binding protein
MSIAILLQGRLERAPERRVSRNGAPFTIATIRVSSGSELQFWRVFVFGETAQAELARLGEGDALTAQGVPKFELYRPEGGEPRVSLSMTADHVLALRQPPRERKPKEKTAPPDTTRPRAKPDRIGDMRTHAGEADPGLDDGIPF